MEIKKKKLNSKGSNISKKQKTNQTALAFNKEMKKDKGFFFTKTAAQTRNLGKLFSSLLKEGDIVFLKGDLGSGKTVFVSGITAAFGNIGFARSSSFILVSEYKAKKEIKLFHLDLYRLSPSSVWDIGIEEYLYGKNIALVEWADRLKDAKDDKTWEVEIEYRPDGRKIIITKTLHRHHK
jgi:tRNA threonylcarbamoyladenosine biosynthesis protein TsaE